MSEVTETIIVQQVVLSVAGASTVAYDILVDGRYCNFNILEEDGTDYLKVKDDDARIGDIVVWRSSDTTPKIRITFTSAFEGLLVVLGGATETYEILDRIDDLEIAVNTLINAANYKFAKVVPVSSAIDIVSNRCSTVETRLLDIEEQLTRLNRYLNTTTVIS